MSKRKRRPRTADAPASRRYVAETVRRARDEIIRAVLWATAHPSTPEAMTQAELERRLDGYGRRPPRP